MSAQLDEAAAVFHCVVCGPCLRLVTLMGEVTIHHPVPHPLEVLQQPEDEQVHAR
jgi:hypothetical protein